MNRKGLLVLLLFFIVSPTLAFTNTVPDLILFNGKIVTVDADFTIAQAIAIKDNRIQAVGTSSEILALASSETEKVDLEGQMVLPGLIDAHVHPLGAFSSELHEKIPDVHTLKELLDWVASQANIKEKGEWIIHPKFFATRLVEMRQPTLEELDRVAPDHPVFLNGSYGGMINTLAMQVSDIKADTSHPGVLRDAQTGHPTGIIQRSAFSLLKGRPNPELELSYAEKLDALEAMLRRYNQVGLTGITNGYLPLKKLKIYQDLWTSDRLSIRVNANLAAPRFESEEQFSTALQERGFYSRFGNEMLRIGALKFWLDGGILTGTAYLREPWGPKAEEIYGVTDPDYRGIPAMPEATLIKAVSIAHDYGWKLTAHSTGGGAVDMLLRAYEEANRIKPIQPQRFSIIHGNFYTPEAIEKCSVLGVIADCQPAWFYKDADTMLYILGAERIKTFLPLKSMFDAGVIVSGGSDHMVKFDSHSAINPYNPFLGMWVAIARKTERGTVIEPSQAITREQALKMYTINNAYASFEEKVKGSLETGKLADLIVINKDYLTCPVDDIRTIQVKMTMLGGKVVFEEEVMD
jgi:predicted amidohydrolase YtcJ